MSNLNDTLFTIVLVLGKIVNAMTDAINIRAVEYLMLTS